MNNQDRLILDKEQLNNLVNSCQEEIRRLKGALQTHEILLKTNVEENQRLNNVLNEITKIIKFEWENIINYKNYENHIWNVDGLIIKRILDELKESDK